MMKKLYRLLFATMIVVISACVSSKVGALGEAAELTDFQDEMMSVVKSMAKTRIQEYCEVQEISDTYSMISKPAERCDYQNDVNYYISDPLFVFKVSEDEIIRRTDFESFIIFRENDAMYYTDQSAEGGYSEKDSRERFTEVFQNEENFTLLILEGNLWLISETDAILLHQGLGASETIDDSIVRDVRKNVLRKYQYSFYKHLISFDE